MPERSRPVPVAASRFRLYLAASGWSAFATGGALRTRLCRPGISQTGLRDPVHPALHRRQPPRRTRRPSRTIQGIQATSASRSRARWRRPRRPTGGAPPARRRRPRARPRSGIGLRLPELEQHVHGQDRRGRRDDVHQRGAEEVRDHELRDREEEPATRQAGQTSTMPRKPAIAHTSQNGTRARRTAAAGRPWRRGQLVQAGDLGERDDGGAERAVGDRGGVADEGQAGGGERLEAEADQHGGADRHRRAEAGRALDEGAESEADEEHLDAAVGREAGDCLLHHLELPGLDGDVVDEDCVQDDPADGEQAEQRAVQRGGAGHRGGIP